VKIRGVWVYLYRAGDRDGQTIDFRLSAKRDGAANASFRKAINHQGCPSRAITLDGYAASHGAVREMKADGPLPGDAKLRSLKYLNNLIEQNHCGVKLRLGPMLGLKRFRTAVITIGGIEPLRRIHKEQFNRRSLRLKGHHTPAVRSAVLAGGLSFAGQSHAARCAEPKALKLGRRWRFVDQARGTWTVSI